MHGYHNQLRRARKRLRTKGSTPKDQGKPGLDGENGIILKAICSACLVVTKAEDQVCEEEIGGKEKEDVADQ